MFVHIPHPTPQISTVATACIKITFNTMVKIIVIDNVFKSNFQDKHSKHPEQFLFSRATFAGEYYATQQNTRKAHGQTCVGGQEKLDLPAPLRCHLLTGYYVVSICDGPRCCVLASSGPVSQSTSTIWSSDQTIGTVPCSWEPCKFHNNPLWQNTASALFMGQETKNYNNKFTGTGQVRIHPRLTSSSGFIEKEKSLPKILILFATHCSSP